MKPRKLHLDDLRVETFEVSREKRGRGTVHALQLSGACTSYCSGEPETCAALCTFSRPEERACIDTNQFGCVGSGMPYC